MDNEKSVWDRLSGSYLIYAQALIDFFSQDVDRISLMKDALIGQDRIIAIHLLQYLTPSEHLQLFDELVYLSSFSHGSIEAVRQVILAMPRDWVLANIEQSVEPLLKNGTYDEYRRLLELYLEIDRDLTIRLAKRATEHNDPDVKEAGEEFLNRLKYV